MAGPDPRARSRAVAGAARWALSEPTFAPGVWKEDHQSRVIAMAKSVEQSTREFYDERGWKGGEDRLFRQFSPAYRQYHAAAVARTIDCFSGRSGSLLIAGGGDMPDSHIDIATKF